MTVRLAASILFVVLPLAGHGQAIGVVPDPYPAPGAAVVANVDGGQRNMQRAVGVEDRRRQREFDRKEHLELAERQREIDRQHRAIEQQRRQLLQLQQLSTGKDPHP
jgi:hypothetical protein